MYFLTQVNFLVHVHKVYKLRKMKRLCVLKRRLNYLIFFALRLCVTSLSLVDALAVTQIALISSVENYATIHIVNADSL